MILEHAVLDVAPERAEEFEAVFQRATTLIAATNGFQGLTLSRCHEQPGRYLLLVRWRALEDHTEGFRGSDAYQEWRALLHHFYDPFPTVEHYATCIEVGFEGMPTVEGARPGTAFW